MDSIISQILIYGYYITATIVILCFAIATIMWFVTETAKICKEMYEDFTDFFRK